MQGLSIKGRSQAVRQITETAPGLTELTANTTISETPSSCTSGDRRRLIRHTDTRRDNDASTSVKSGAREEREGERSEIGKRYSEEESGKDVRTRRSGNGDKREAHYDGPRQGHESRSRVSQSHRSRESRHCSEDEERDRRTRRHSDRHSERDYNYGRTASGDKRDKGRPAIERDRNSRSRSRDRHRGRDPERHKESRAQSTRDRDHKRTYRDVGEHRRDSNTHRSRRALSTSSSSSDSENSEEEARRRRKRRKEKERRQEDEEREERRRRRKDKEGSHKKHTASSTGSYGKFGVITVNDQSRLAFEFRAWLVEQRRLDPDAIPRDKLKKEFATFVEDFNTATLPHEKYYNMAQHQARIAAMRNGTTVTEAPKYDPRADEKAHVARLRAVHVPDEADLTREEIIELRRIEKERVEAAKRRQLGLEVPKGLGVRMVEVPLESWKDPNLF